MHGIADKTYRLQLILHQYYQICLLTQRLYDKDYIDALTHLAYLHQLSWTSGTILQYCLSKTVLIFEI